MRKFRFIGDPEEWDNVVEKNKVYDCTFIPKEYSHYDIATYSFNFPEDWQEVFDEPKKLHKDTDLGYFAGVALHGLLANSKNYDSTVNFSIAAIKAAKELIQQLDQEQ